VVYLLKKFTDFWLILYNLSPNYPHGIWLKSLKFLDFSQLSSVQNFNISLFASQVTFDLRV